jgi:hypothetical protein
MTYIFNPIDFNIINIEKNSDRFFNSIKNDPYLMSSYQNTFLLGSTFSSIYKRSFKGDQFYLRFNTDLKGNLLWLGSKIFNAKQAEEVLDEDTQEKHNFYQILETKFAQYAKFDLNITYTKQLNDITSLATRFFGGVGFAYGNSYSLPFDKMYYVGGAYSMRGWQIRTLGPGSYAPDTAGNILNHLADMRLEANVEYRFKLFWKLEGAVFLDAGNIWTISSKDNRENVRFTLRDFPRQIAINWGLGLRLNFNFLVVRLDYGIQLHDPKNSKYFNAPNVWFKSNNNTYSIALGYPF